MMIFGLFITRKHEKDIPELVDAWDEYTIEENPDGYQEAIRKWQGEEDVDSFAVVGFSASDQLLLNALYPDPVVIEAKDLSRVDIAE